MNPVMQLGKDINLIDGANTRDLTGELIDPEGIPRVMSADYYRQTTAGERSLFCVRNGLYGLITVELVDWIRQQIGGRTAIEIGAGNGVLASALRIPATDNRMQEDPVIQAHYAAFQQPTVKYGKAVEKLDAVSAVAKYNPQVVIACWVTHLYRADRHSAGGNAFGVNEEAIISNCEDYIFVGNTRVHAGKSIWNLPHEKASPDWLYSRAMNGTADFVAVWHGAKHPRALA